MTKEISEENIILHVRPEEVPSKKMAVFYNPVMKHQRDIAIAIIKHIQPQKVALPLAGTGIRGIRIIQNCPNTKVYFNDMSETATDLINQNLESNNISGQYTITTQDANIFLRTNGFFDYIDIDPYGSSIYFIESAIYSLIEGGILAVTNTDTAALCGSYPKVCLRRYGSLPIESEMMHEFATRILIRKIQEIGCMYDRALIPVLAYTKDHYVRVYFRLEKGKKACDALLEKHKTFTQDELKILHETPSGYGPVWTGPLAEKKFLDLLPSNKFNETLQKQLDVFMGYDLHELCGLLKIDIPRIDVLIEKIRKKGYLCTRTIFSQTAIKTTMPEKELIALLTHR